MTSFSTYYLVGVVFFQFYPITIRSHFAREHIFLACIIIISPFTDEHLVSENVKIVNLFFQPLNNSFFYC